MATNQQVAERLSRCIHPDLRSITVTPYVEPDEPLTATVPPSPYVRSTSYDTNISLLPNCNIRALKGSNFEVFPHVYNTSQTLRDSAGLFLPLTCAMSYNTIIARMIYNMHTQAPELWISDHGYSDTTRRHRRYIQDEYFIACNKHGFTASVYYTNAADKYNQRADRIEAEIIAVDTVYDRVQRNMKEAIAPKKHKSTRYAALHAAKGFLDAHLRKLTEGVPQELVADLHHADKYRNIVANAQAMSELINTAKELPLEDMRAFINGYFALERNN